MAFAVLLLSAILFPLMVFSIWTLLPTLPSLIGLAAECFLRTFLQGLSLGFSSLVCGLSDFSFGGNRYSMSKSVLLSPLLTIGPLVIKTW